MERAFSRAGEWALEISTPGAAEGSFHGSHGVPVGPLVRCRAAVSRHSRAQAGVGFVLFASQGWNSDENGHERPRNGHGHLDWCWGRRDNYWPFPVHVVLVMADRCLVDYAILYKAYNSHAGHLAASFTKALVGRHRGLRIDSILPFRVLRLPALDYCQGFYASVIDRPQHHGVVQ